MVESLDELDMSGIATRLMPSTKALFKTLKQLAFGGFNVKSLNAIFPNHICYLLSLELHFQTCLKIKRTQYY